MSVLTTDGSDELNDGLGPLFQETVARYVEPRARVVRWEQQPMGAQEQGWSGAELRRYRIELRGEAELTLITKTMPLKERLALLRLNEQGHANVPYTHTRDLITDGPALAAMQDLGGDTTPRPADLIPRTARGLAAIHHRNLGQGAAMPWLPPADRAYYAEFLVPQVWRAHWETALQTPAFAREFAAYTPRLEAAADHFIRIMSALWEEGTTLTLTNGDMHPADGGNFIVYQGRPYFLDWGWTYYAPFYLDLPNAFTAETVRYYREALADLGLEIPERDFMERYHEAGRYVGFKYLCAGIWQWPPGPTEQTGAMLLQMLKRALDGRFPESAFTLSPPIRQALLTEHQQFVGVPAEPVI